MGKRYNIMSTRVLNKTRTLLAMQRGSLHFLRVGPTSVQEYFPASWYGKKHRFYKLLQDGIFQLTMVCTDVDTSPTPLSALHMLNTSPSKVTSRTPTSKANWIPTSVALASVPNAPKVRASFWLRAAITSPTESRITTLILTCFCLVKIAPFTLIL